MPVSLTSGLSLTGIQSQLAHPGVTEPTNDDIFSALTVATDGWTLDATLLGSVAGGTYSGLNDFATPGGKLTATRKTPTPANPTATADFDVPLTSVKRKPYPNGTSLEETASGLDLTTKYSLAEFIYASESVSALFEAGFFTDNGAGGSSAANSGGTASVTNSSTRDYPFPQMAWLHHDLEHITGSSFTAKLWAFHTFARSGRPLHSVEIIATDQHANSVSGTATVLTSEQFANGLYASFYQVVLDFSTLTQGDLVTLDAKAYPWIGDVYQISVDGHAYGSPNISPIKVLNDRTGGYGTAIAYVDGVGAGTPAVGSDTTPYATIAAAATAIQAYNNANFGRNNLGGGIVRIMAGTTITGLGTDGMDGLVDGLVPLVIEGVNQTTSIWTPSAANNDIPGILKFSNLTYRHLAATIALDGKNLVTNMLVFEDVIFDANGQARYDAANYQYGRGYAIDCTGDEIGQLGIYSANQGCVLALGCDFIPARTYSAIASRHEGANFDIIGSASSNLGTMKGPILANCVVSSNKTSTQIVVYGAQDFGPHGAAIVGNVLESYATTQTGLKVFGDADTTACTNINIVGNTVVGNRTNFGYNDTANVLRDGLLAQNVLYEINQKGDFHASDGSFIGNWSLRHFVGGFHNFIIRGDNNNQVVGDYDNWFGEGLGDAKNELSHGWVVTGDPDFANDQSVQGGNAGGGDYTPGAATDITTIPAGETMFSVDLFGTPIPTDGTALVGAVQKAA